MYSHQILLAVAKARVIGRSKYRRGIPTRPVYSGLTALHCGLIAAFTRVDLYSHQILLAFAIARVIGQSKYRRGGSNTSSVFWVNL